MTERNRKRVGVPKKLWKKLGPLGQAACNRMWDIIGQDGGRGETVVHPDASKMKRVHWKTIKYNMSLLAAFVATEMKEDEDTGIAKWIKK